MPGDWAFQLLGSPLTVDTAPDQPEPMAVLDDPIQFFGDEPIQDPYPLYDRMRSEAPVHRIGQSVFYAVCSWDAVVECVNRVEDFSSNLTATMVYQDDGTVTPFLMGPLDDPSHVLAVADDPAHAAHRKVLVPHLSAKRIRDIESFAAYTADRLWRENVHGGQIEWMSAMANRLPMMVVARLIGVPEDDVDQLIRLGIRHHHVARWRRRSGPTSSGRSRRHGVGWLRVGALRQSSNQPARTICSATSQAVAPVVSWTRSPRWA